MVHEDSMMNIGPFRINDNVQKDNLLIWAPSIEDIEEDVHNEDDEGDFKLDEEEKKLDWSYSNSHMIKSISISDLGGETKS